MRMLVLSISLIIIGCTIFTSNQEKAEQWLESDPIKTQVDELKKQCEELRVRKYEINLSSQNVKEYEVYLISNFDEYQLEMYSNLYDSKLDDKVARVLLFRKKLEKTLNEKQKRWLGYTLMGLDFISQWSQEYQIKRQEFENNKAKFLSVLEFSFKSEPGFIEEFELLKLLLEQQLSCE